MPSGRASSRLSLFLTALAVASILCAAGCASIPGKTGEEQAITIEELERKTLADLRQQAPKTEQEIAECVGYVIMHNKLTKIPIVGVGSGYGVAVDSKTGERTYLRMRRFDIGAGWGARSVRPVLIFQNDEKFRDYIEGGFDATVGAEAAAKVGEAGAAGGGSGAAVKDLGYTSYMLTDAGVSATASVAVIRVKQIELKK